MAEGSIIEILSAEQVNYILSKIQDNSTLKKAVKNTCNKIITTFKNLKVAQQEAYAINSTNQFMRARKITDLFINLKVNGALTEKGQKIFNLYSQLEFYTQDLISLLQTGHHFSYVVYYTDDEGHYYRKVYKKAFKYGDLHGGGGFSDTFKEKLNKEFNRFTKYVEKAKQQQINIQKSIQKYQIAVQSHLQELSDTLKQGNRQTNKGKIILGRIAKAKKIREVQRSIRNKYMKDKYGDEAGKVQKTDEDIAEIEKLYDKSKDLKKYDTTTRIGKNKKITETWRDLLHYNQGWFVEAFEQDLAKHWRGISSLSDSVSNDIYNTVVTAISQHKWTFAEAYKLMKETARNNTPSWKGGDVPLSEFLQDMQVKTIKGQILSSSQNTYASVIAITDLATQVLDYFKNNEKKVQGSDLFNTLMNWKKDSDKIVSQQLDNAVQQLFDNLFKT